MKNILIIIALSFVTTLSAQHEHKIETTKTEASATQSEPLKENGKDPVCKMKVKKGTTFTSNFKGKQYGFCNAYCKEVFDEKPEKYVKQ